MLGLFYEPASAAAAIEQLRALGVSDDQMTVLSNAPFKHQILGRPKPKGRVGRIALFGALLGLSLGIFLTLGIFVLYPIEQGGQPIVPIPPSLIILFETTMLGTMWASFFGLLGESRLPIFKRQIYDPRITEGLIGVAVSSEENLLPRIEEALRANGTHDVVNQDADLPEDRTHLRFWMGAGVAVLALGAITMLMAYDVIKIPFPTQMAEQESLGYLEGPRKAAPAEAVPIQGPVLIGDQPFTTPVPASADSVQRGKYLFSITCAVCHGPAGDGKSPIAAFFKPPPFDLTGATVQQLSDQEIYVVITNGFKSMPSQAENLNREERWDVVNYVRTLKK